MSAGCAVVDKTRSAVNRGIDSIRTERKSSSKDKPLTPPKVDKTSAAKPKKEKTQTAVKAVKKGNKTEQQQETAVTQKELANVKREVAAQEAAAVEKPVAVVPEKGASNEHGPLVVEHKIPSDFSIEGEWTIFSVKGNKLKGEERPYIFLDLAAKRFYGCNGCNYVNGDLLLKGKGALQFTNMASTQKLCQDAQFEHLINLALDGVRSYAARQQGPITFLDLKGADGKTLMVLRRHNMDFLNGAWKVLDLNGTPLKDDASMTISIPDLKIHGTTGCNIFNGELFIDPDKIDSMQFLQIATTRMACAPESRETEFLIGLESVETAKKLTNDSIAMFDPEGKELFKMVRMDMRPDSAE